MKVPFSWLKDYVEIDVSAEELAARLFSCGFEVEELVYCGAEIRRCVVGRIREITPHPDSDHLLVCRLDCGEYGDDLQIVTGAHNVRVNDLVPVALDGSSLAGGVKIKKGKLRGVESNGMLCSGGELGINDDWYDGADVDGILILGDGPAPGTDIRGVVGLDDYIFDIAVTANRPDCQSVYGIAREVAAVLGKPVRTPDLSYSEGKAATEDMVSVRVEAPDLCRRYIAHGVRNIRVRKSPLWMRRRLALCGLRAISNIVDITNYILLELGQPMHAFDLSLVTGRSICIRRADRGEKITTLDGKTFSLSERNLVIADGEGPVALAGIMGGLSSGISEKTEEVLFECAKFERANIRHTSRELGQKSDSSARYEKGVDIYTTGIAINRALHLIEELDCGVIARGRYDLCSEKLVPKVIETSVSAINGLLGIEVSREDMKDILNRLNFSVTCAGDKLTVTAPAYREDVDGYPDIAEEVIRMYGYDNIAGTFLKEASVTHGGLTPEQEKEERARRRLTFEGCSEIITYSFISPKDYALLRIPEEGEKAIRIQNPIGEDMSLMRTTLVPSMLSAIVRNIRRGNETGRLYELASVYLGAQPLTDLPEERATLCVGAWGAQESFYTAKGLLEAAGDSFGLKFSFRAGQRPFLHPGKCAEVLLDGAVIGCLGELAPDLAEELSLDAAVQIGEIDFGAVSAKALPRVRYAPLPQYPEVKRDLALVADESVLNAEVEACIRGSSKYVTSVRLFDVYRSAQIGEGRKSMAYSVTFTPGEKAISPEDADGYVRKILKNLKEKLGITLR